MLSKKKQVYPTPTKTNPHYKKETPVRTVLFAAHLR